MVTAHHASIGDKQLDPQKIAKSIFHEPIIRVDYPMLPYQRPELPTVQIISGAHQHGHSLDERQRLLVWDQVDQWDSGNEVAPNDIHCWEFAEDGALCTKQVKAVLRKWQQLSPDWIKNEVVVFTIDGQPVEGIRDTRHVQMAAAVHLTRLYEGIRAEIQHAKYSRQRMGLPERLTDTPYSEWHDRLGFTRAAYLDDRTMRNILKSLDNLQYDCRRGGHWEIEFALGRR